MLQYKKGDLLTAPDLCIAHGCNAQGVMGSGVASALRNKWPIVYKNYSSVHNKEGLELGHVYPCHVYIEHRLHQPEKKVYNCITQKFYGRDGHQYVDYSAIRACMSKLRTILQATGQTSISMPKIGAGLGGGEWEVIEKIIIDELAHTRHGIEVTIWEL